MDTRDREAIDGLFNRIEDVERQAGPRDAQAERLIAERLQRQPAAPYYLAQTVVMQDFALKALQEKVDALEKAGKAQPEASEGGGFFSRSAGFGAPSPSRTSVPVAGSRGPWGQAEPQPGAYSQTSAPVTYAQPPQPYPAQAYAPQPPYAPTSQGFGGMGGGRMGGGFLAGAAQTAVGVAGGVVLGSALGSMFGGHGGGLFGGGPGLAGGDVTEVTENVTNVYEAPQENMREVSDTMPAEDAGYQDTAYGDPGVDDGFGGADDGFETV